MPDYPSSIRKRIRRLHHQGEIPSHVAVIMDGNGRWARRHGVDLSQGHREGVHSVRAVADLCGEIEAIKVLTFYAFSTENWARPRHEVQSLMELLKEFLRKEVNRMIERNVRFDTIGDPSAFPEDVREELERTKTLTESNEEFLFNLAVNYGGRDEITRAVQSIARKVQEGEVTVDEVDETMISNHLDSAGLVDPDLLIRTSGERRLSNFLLWQIAYSEVYFTDTLWPDFREEAFLDALFDYQQRDRRFGRRPNVES